MSLTTLPHSGNSTQESNGSNEWDSSSSVSSGTWESLSTVSYPDLDEPSDDESNYISENTIKLWKCVYLIKHVRWAIELREPRGAELVPFTPRTLEEQREIEEWRPKAGLQAYAHLPDELLFGIMSYVRNDLVTFFMLRQVSRRFRTLVNTVTFQDHVLSTYHGCRMCNNADMRCLTYQRIGIDEKVWWGIRRRPVMRSAIRAILRRDHLCLVCQVKGFVLPVGMTCGCEDEEFLDDDESTFGEYNGYDEFSEPYIVGTDYQYDSGEERYALYGEDRHEPW